MKTLIVILAIPVLLLAGACELLEEDTSYDYGNATQATARQSSQAYNVFPSHTAHPLLTHCLRKELGEISDNTYLNSISWASLSASSCGRDYGNVYGGLRKGLTYSGLQQCERASGVPRLDLERREYNNSYFSEMFKYAWCNARFHSN